MSRPTKAPALPPGTRVRAHSLEPSRAAMLRLKRERIIAVAGGVFYENGFCNTTLDAVAGRLEVTKPFIYSQ